MTLPIKPAVVEVGKLGELPKVHEAQLSGVGNVCELLALVTRVG